MMDQASAYNGGAHTLTGAKASFGTGNTGGSLSEEERAVVVGSLLGDGAMRCKTNALLEVNHSLAQKDYVDWKYRKLQRLVRTPPKARRGNEDRMAYRFTTRSLPELTGLYRWFYEARRKRVPDDLQISPLALAVWVMDDGCKSHRAMYLNTQQFKLGEQELLIEILQAQYGIRATLNRDKRYTRIRIAVDSVARLYEVVRSHVLPCLRYKFPLMTP